MKIEFTAEERKYLYNLLKLIALNTKDVPQSAGFWLGLANRLGPNQAVVHLRRSHAKFILTAVESAVKSINNSNALQDGTSKAGQRADMLRMILERATKKLEAKMAQEKDDDNNGTT